MDLQREIAAAHGIEIVETNGELGAEGLEDMVSEEVFRLEEDEIDSGNLDHARTKGEAQAVLLGHAIEAPCVIWRAIREIEFLLHPMAAPGAGIEEGNDTEWTTGGAVERRAKG